RVPRLFISLFLWPLVIGLGIVVVQTVLSGGMLKVYHEDSEKFRKRIERETERVTLRKWVHDTDQPLPPPVVCVWGGPQGDERPLSPHCDLDPRDLVLRLPESSAGFDPSKYVESFSGATRRIHICRECRSSIEVDLRGNEPVTNVYGLQGMGVSFLSDSERFTGISAHLIRAIEAEEALGDLQGDILLRPPGLDGAINVTDSKSSMILIINVAAIVIIAAWLALKAHRRVLDYFIKNEALLPLVAACGKETMYRALWILSLTRVTLFLLSAVLPMYLIFAFAGELSANELFNIERSYFLLWMGCLIFGLSGVTILVSVADLKQRYATNSLLYRAGPFTAWGIGSLVWLATLFFAGELSSIVQAGVTAIPILGLSAVILAPIIPVKPALLGAHTLFSILLTLIVMSRNTNWFAAHLEEM
ncbi:MAG: hypothetical protein IT290_13555, partial [Deltaproteobacteria bacterium]|nr:hypothetical protein [Deltaproteobacteria bacterium]